MTLLTPRLALPDFLPSSPPLACSPVSVSFLPSLPTPAILSSLTALPLFFLSKVIPLPFFLARFFQSSLTLVQTAMSSSLAPRFVEPLPHPTTALQASGAAQFLFPYHACGKRLSMKHFESYFPALVTVAVFALYLPRFFAHFRASLTSQMKSSHATPAVLRFLLAAAASLFERKVCCEKSVFLGCMHAPCPGAFFPSTFALPSPFSPRCP
jgi:hypothetical protein